MKTFYFTQASVVLLAIIKFGDVSACMDTLSKESAINVTDEKTGEVFTISNCKKLFDMFPGTCESKNVGGKGGLCCETCGDPNCLDKLSKFVPGSIGDKEVKSCSDVAKDYKFQCIPWGKKKGMCCRSCQGVDTKCLDLNRGFILRGKTYDCAGFVELDQCHCMDKKRVKKPCCESCKNVDIKKLGCKCRDTASKDNPFELTLNGETRNFTDCQVIVDYLAQLCTKLGKKGKTCCASCAGVDRKCFDNLGWRANVVSPKMNCKNCTCHDIINKSESLMKFACDENIEGINDFTRKKPLSAQKACCLQCKRVAR